MTSEKVSRQLSVKENDYFEKTVCVCNIKFSEPVTGEFFFFVLSAKESGFHGLNGLFPFMPYSLDRLHSLIC